MVKFFPFLLVLLWRLLLPLPAWAVSSWVAAPGAGASAQPKQKIASLKPDERVFRLYEFLEKRQSPLAPYASDFIAQANLYKIDWRLLPSISGLESRFGQLMIDSTFNAYGYGGGRLYFSSWPDSIAKMSQYLSSYYQRGLDNPYKIGPVYAPPCSYWGRAVSKIMADISPSL